MTHTVLIAMGAMTLGVMLGAAAVLATILVMLGRTE